MTTQTDSRPRLTMVLQDLDFGGTQRQALTLASVLPRDLLAVDMVSLVPGGGFLGEAKALFDSVSVVGTDKTVTLASLKGLWRHLKATRPKALMPLTAVPNIWARVFGRALRLPLVVGTCRGGGAIKRQHERFLARLAHHHVCNTMDLAQRLTRLTGLPEDRVTVIPNGLDTERFVPVAEDFAPVRETIVCVARMCEDKDHETLLEAFKILAAKNPRAELWLVGDGPLLRELSKKILRHPAKARIRHYPGGDPRPFYHQAKVAVLSSVREGLPNVLLEAAACGLPVVATSVGGIPEAVVQGETGLLVPPNDPAAMAQALEAILDDETLRRDMGQKARARAEARYSLEALSASYVGLFGRLGLLG